MLVMLTTIPSFTVTETDAGQVETERDGRSNRKSDESGTRQEAGLTAKLTVEGKRRPGTGLDLLTYTLDSPLVVAGGEEGTTYGYLKSRPPSVLHQSSTTQQQGDDSRKVVARNQAGTFRIALSPCASSTLAFCRGTLY